MNITKNINKNIFREYDIRGIADIDLTDDVVYTIGKAFGSYLRKQGNTETIVGYDNRLSSKRIFNALSKGITSAGINITNLGLVTTPMYYSSWTILNQTSGIMITASHNPKEDNGLKLSYNGKYNAFGDMVRMLKNIIDDEEFTDGSGTINDVNIYKDYVEYITKSINLGNKDIKVIIDCGNGTGSIIVEQIFKKLNINYIPIFCTSDGNFPNHHPDPSVESNLTYLKEEVLKNKADLGLSFDGDADRLGIIDEYGNLIPIDLFMAIIWRNLMPKTSNKRALFDVKCSKALEDEIIKLGGIPIMNRTGASYQRFEMYDKNYTFGGEMSGHVYFNDKFPGYDDGIYAGLRLIEILSYTNKSLSMLLDGINKYYSTPELKIKVEESDKSIILNKVKEYVINSNYKYIDIDGIKVLFNDGFALVRASNTGPNLSLRFEANTKQRLEEIKQEFTTLLDNIII